MKIAVCDDEAYFRDYIKELIETYYKDTGEVCQVDLFSSGIELMGKGIELKEYDVFFLDVNMDEMDGIETAKNIRILSQDVFIVFVTAYVTYAVEGYKVDVIRYLLKDESSMENGMRECLDTIMDKKRDSAKTLTFSFLEGVTDLVVEELMYVESDLHKLKFYVMKNKVVQYSMYEKLDIIEQMVENQKFCRIHKSYFANMRYAIDLSRYKLTMIDGTVLNIAKPRYREVEKVYLMCRGEF